MHVQSTIHAVIVVCMAIGPLMGLSEFSTAERLGAPEEFSPGADLEETARIANASHVFFCYMIVDTLVQIYRRELTLDYFAHHAVFIFFCIVIQGNCFAPYLAAWLLIMEMSTIPLNSFSFFRNRLGYDSILVQGSFLTFAVTFITCRLFGTTYIALYFNYHVWQGVVYEKPFSPSRIVLDAICWALVLATGLQVYWAYGIIQKLMKVLGSKSAANLDLKEQEGYVQIVAD